MTAIVQPSDVALLGYDYFEEGGFLNLLVYPELLGVTTILLRSILQSLGYSITGVTDVHWGEKDHIDMALQTDMPYSVFERIVKSDEIIRYC